MSYRKRFSITLKLEDLETDPGPDDAIPYLYIAQLNGGQRDVLSSLGFECSSKIQELKDAHKDVYERVVTVERGYNEVQGKVVMHLSEENVERVADLSDEARQDCERLYVEHGAFEEETLNGCRHAAEALQVAMGQITLRHHMSRAALVIKRIGGKWSLHDSDLADKPVWPKRVDPLDPHEALEKRVEVLRLVGDEDLARIYTAVDSVIRGGGAGLTGTERGN